MLKLALLFAPIQSFVVTNIIKGMTISNTLILLMMAKSFLTFRRKIIAFTLIFSVAYISYFLIAQFSILVFPPNYIMNDLVYISNESINQLYFRKSFITQSLYLFVVVIFFYFLLLYFRKYGRDKALDISFWSIIIFVIYGYFEFFMYLITGQNFDFISSKISKETFKEAFYISFNQKNTDDKILILGQLRNDVLKLDFKFDNELFPECSILNSYRNKYSKIVSWLPTHRTQLKKTIVDIMDDNSNNSFGISNLFYIPRYVILCILYGLVLLQSKGVFFTLSLVADKNLLSKITENITIKSLETSPKNVILKFYNQFKKEL